MRKNDAFQHPFFNFTWRHYLSEVFNKYSTAAIKCPQEDDPFRFFNGLMTFLGVALSGCNEHCVLWGALAGLLIVSPDSRIFSSKPTNLLES